MARTKWTPPASPPPAELPPETWHEMLGVEVWTDGKGNFAILGTLEPDDDGAHSCDEMGCRSGGLHVLHRLRGRAL